MCAPVVDHKPSNLNCAPACAPKLRVVHRTMSGAQRLHSMGHIPFSFTLEPAYFMVI